MFERLVPVFLWANVATRISARGAHENEVTISTMPSKSDGKNLTEAANLADLGPLWTDEHWKRSEIEHLDVEAFKKFTRGNYTREYAEFDVHRLLEPPTDDASFLSTSDFFSVPDETWRIYMPFFDTQAPGLAVIWTNTSRYAGDAYDHLVLSLKNKMTVNVQIPHYATSKADVVINFRGGANFDPSYLQGLHHFTEHMILLRDPGVVAAELSPLREGEQESTAEDEDNAGESHRKRDRSVFAAFGGSEGRISPLDGIKGSTSPTDMTLGWSVWASDAAVKLPMQLRKLLCPQIPFASVAHELDAMDTEADFVGKRAKTHFSSIVAMAWRRRARFVISPPDAVELRRFAVEHGIERLREEAAAVALNVLTATGAVAQLDVPKLGSPGATFAYLMPLLRRLSEFPDQWRSSDVAARAACSGMNPERIIAARARQVADSRRDDLLPSVQLAPGFAPSAAAAELLPDFLRHSQPNESDIRWNKLGLMLLHGSSSDYVPHIFSVAYPFITNESVGVAGGSFLTWLRAIVNSHLWPPDLVAAWDRCGVLPPLADSLDVYSLSLSAGVFTLFFELHFPYADTKILADRERDFTKRMLESQRRQMAAASDKYSTAPRPPPRETLALPEGNRLAHSGEAPVSIYDSPAVVTARCAVAALLHFFANFAATVADETILAVMGGCERRFECAARRLLLQPPERGSSIPAFAAPHAILPHLRAATVISRASPTVVRRGIRLFLRPENMILKVVSPAVASRFYESSADIYLTPPHRIVRVGVDVLPAAVMAEMHAALDAGAAAPSVEGWIRTKLDAVDGAVANWAAALSGPPLAPGGLAETATDRADRAFRTTVASLLTKRGMRVDPAFCAVKIEEERLVPQARALLSAPLAPASPSSAASPLSAPSGRRRSLVLRFAASPSPGATPWGVVSANLVPEVAVQAEWRSPLQLASPESERAIRLLRRIINKALIRRWRTKQGRAAVAAVGFPWLSSARNPSAGDPRFGVTLSGPSAEGLEDALREFAALAGVFDAGSAAGAAGAEGAPRAPGVHGAVAAPPSAALELVSAWESVLESTTGKVSLSSLVHWSDALDRFSYTGVSWPSSLAELEHLFLHWRAAVAFSSLRVLVGGDLMRKQARRIGAALAAPARGALERYTDLRDPVEYLGPARVKLAVGAVTPEEVGRWGRFTPIGMPGFAATWVLRRPRADEPAGCRIDFLARFVGQIMQLASSDIWRFASGMVYNPYYEPIKDATNEAAWVTLAVQSSFYSAGALEEQLPEVLALTRRRLLATTARAWRQAVQAAVLEIIGVAQPLAAVPAALVGITKNSKPVQDRLRCVPPLLQLEQLPGNDFSRLLLSFFDAYFPVYGPRSRLQVYLADGRPPSGEIPSSRRPAPVHWGPSFRDGYATVGMTEPLSGWERDWLRLQRESRTLRCHAPSAEEQLAVWRLARHLLSSSTPRRSAQKFV